MREGTGKRIVFKCAFGAENGWGHVVRCSALASQFKDHGWETLLWSEGDLNTLPQDVAHAFTGAYSAAKAEAAILLVDEMYTDQSVYEDLVKDWKTSNPHGLVAGIDDMQLRSMRGFDLVVNTEIGLRAAKYDAPHMLLGERYALVRPGFASTARAVDRELDEDSVPVLIMMGGTDAFGYLPKVLAALSRFDSINFVPVVVAGETFVAEDWLAGFRDVRILKAMPASELAAWMNVCRIGIVSCGSGVYECAAMGLPFVGVSLVDNQVATARKIETYWGLPIFYCIDVPGDRFELGLQLSAVLKMQCGSYSEVDTKGAARVYEALQVLLG